MHPFKELLSKIFNGSLSQETMHLGIYIKYENHFNLCIVKDASVSVNFYDLIQNLFVPGKVGGFVNSAVNVGRC